MVGLSGKIRLASVKASIDSSFPGFRRWLRMPGLQSWAAAAAGTMLAFALPFRAGEPLLHRASFAALAAFAAAGILVRRPAARFSAFLLFAFLLCLMRRAHQYDVFAFTRQPSGTPELTVLAGRVASAPLPALENFHFLLRIDSTGSTPFRPLAGKTVNCVSPVEPPLYGTVTVRGAFLPPVPRRNPREYDGFTCMMAKGVWGTFAADGCRTLSLTRSLPERCAASFRKVTGNALGKVRDYDNRALLQAVFLGDTEFLSPFIKDIFRKSGIYHLIAISGLNTAILTGALYFFLSLFRLKRIIVHLVCIAALWAYLPFVGMIPSLFRATVMATCVIAAVFFEKKNYALHTLGLAGTLWFALSPESLFEPGYQLSFAATAGILTLHPLFSRFTPRPDNRFLRPVITFLFSSFYISLASFLATAPILLYHFGTVSYFGLLANLVAVAAMTVAMWAFFAGLLCQMALPFCAALPLWISERFLDIVIGTGKLACHISWSQKTYAVPPPEIILLFSVFLLGMAAVHPCRLGRYILASIIAAALFVPADLLARRQPQRLEAVRFAVPKGQLLGVRWPDRRVWIVAPYPSRSLPYLIERHVLPWARHCAGRTRPDALVVPEDFSVPADTLFERNFRAAPDRLITFPAADSFMSIFTPGRRCTCAISRGGGNVRVRIAAPFFDTTLSLAENGGSKRRKRADREMRPARSAVIMTAGGKRIRSRTVVRSDHPVW
ncbi:MAG: ComEC/Rec2 family competence protein [Chitinispirillaceae bacterium]|nr:ComEC/Rec2 family competence protein [Chitinispirillaceae bacterium]